MLFCVIAKGDGEAVDNLWFVTFGYQKIGKSVDIRTAWSFY